MFFLLIINWIRSKVEMSRGIEEEHIELRAAELCTVVRNWNKP